MSEYDIIRAWKDEDYLESLSEEQRSQLPENPAGITNLSDEDMESIGGGGDSNAVICVTQGVNCQSKAIYCNSNDCKSNAIQCNTQGMVCL